ncbi:MAG TPA: carbamoyltransferase HypF, partial [Verrucomicrobiota bacterium]|nr:carbamoyltransferase HypF [Verrucomicrobiota bacterium]
MMTLNTRADAAVARLRLAVQGAVQGVGFRPFVYRLACELGLPGWVNNSAQGVFIEVEGERPALEQFLLRLGTDKPPRSFIHSCETTWLDVAGYDGFEIRESELTGNKTALVLPDIATCPDCLREIRDPSDRRYQYPFTNCTNCGPRFSIIESLPYDRANTSMKAFAMCPACQAEYDDPTNRRFHAQPNACPVCGPQLELWRGCIRERSHDALLAAAQAIREGQIVALKGIGGFHLMVDARNENAVGRLRDRKHREEKPFALMFPTLASVKEVCEVSSPEERLLCSPESPIVLLRRLRVPRSTLPVSIAPGNPNLGVMLPSNPLHHLLMAELGFPVVATSGNLSDEPICTDELDALERLHDIADVFLIHNRPIVRHVDDSIVRVMLDREMILRRARGYAPLPVQLPVGADVRRLTLKAGTESEPPHVGCYEPVLAVGAHLKNSVALAAGEQVFLSQHIGDLETEQANRAFRRATQDLSNLYDLKPGVVAADLHPDYLSTQFALERRVPARQVGYNRVNRAERVLG